MNRPTDGVSRDGQPDEQLGGVRETIGNYLQYFLTPEVAEVFCTGESTFGFAAIDQGKIILTTMPQKFQTERRYVNTLLKLLYYNHALRRFDKTKADRAKNNLLILWADEAQRFMTASEDGTSDYNCVDVIREAGATVSICSSAAGRSAPGYDSSNTSLRPPLHFPRSSTTNRSRSSHKIGGNGSGFYCLVGGPARERWCHPTNQTQS